MPDRTMVSKASAGYRPSAALAQRCATCVMFHPDGTCDLVRGAIDPDATCDRWYPRVKVPAIAALAAEAYLSGWALTEAPVTARTHAGCFAAAGVAAEHRHDPRILEAALELGQAEGTWALIHARRERLLAKHLKAVLAAWKSCTADLDPRDVARRFRRDAYLATTAEAVTKDPAKRWWQDTAIAAALGWLRRTYHHDGYDALVAALADAIRAGMAEGEADALALAAARQGKTGFAIDKAFKAAYARLATDHAIDRQAADAATRIIDGAAADTGRRLASLAGDGADEDTMTDGVQDVTDDQQAPSRWTDWAIWAAIGAAATALFTSAGIGLINWVDVGDSRECATCMDNAAGSPYTLGSVPSYPSHPRCRCSLDAADSSPLSAYLAAYLS